MSVASKNPFSILNEEGDSRPSSPPPASKAPVAPAAPAPARERENAKKGPRGGQYYQRGARGGARGTRGEGNPNQNGVEEDSAPRKFAGERGRGRGREGQRGGQRGGRGRGGARLDRHSATGKTDSEKKIHQGWGGDDGNTELQQENAATVDAAAEAGADSTGDAWGANTGNDASAWDAPAGDAPAAEAGGEAKPTAEGGEREQRRRRDEEEEDNTLTLEQYLAQKKEKESAVLPEKPQGRQANDGAAGDLWDGVVALQKGEEESYFVGKTKSTPKARAKKEEKVYIEIDGTFDRPARGGRGGRGGRGRGGGGERGERGGRGRGGARGGGRQGNGPQAAVVNVEDETAFPSLS